MRMKGLLYLHGIPSIQRSGKNRFLHFEHCSQGRMFPIDILQEQSVFSNQILFHQNHLPFFAFINFGELMRRLSSLSLISESCSFLVYIVNTWYFIHGIKQSNIMKKFGILGMVALLQYLLQFVIDTKISLLATNNSQNMDYVIKIIVAKNRNIYNIILNHNKRHQKSDFLPKYRKR